MGIRVKWNNAEKTILRYTFEGEWSWEELDMARRHGEKMVEGMMQRYDVILDVRRLEGIPRNTLEVIRDHYAVHSPNGGLSVFVGATALMRAILDVLNRLKPNSFGHFRCVQTLEEAYNLIDNHLRVR
jgi:hypothetical protein